MMTKEELKQKPAPFLSQSSDNSSKNQFNQRYGARLTPEQFHIMREGGTETPFSGKYWDEHTKGMYKCAACGQELFSSETKFDSGTGWPSFTEPANLKNIELREDLSGGMKRTEVICKRCGSHLGHVFDDGSTDRGGKRYCINSACLNLEKK